MDNPYKSKETNIPVIDDELQIEVATRLRRFMAFFLDVLFLYLLVLIPAFLSRIVKLVMTGKYPNLDYNEVPIPAALIILVLVMAWSVFTIILLFLKSQTPGKMLLKLQIQDLKGLPASSGKILLRPLFICVFVFFGLAETIVRPNDIRYFTGFSYLIVLADHLAIFSKRRLCLHDLFTGTRVVMIREKLKSSP